MYDLMQSYSLSLRKITNLNKTELIERANRSSKNTLMETLKIRYTDIGEDYVVAEMPVSSAVSQPMGLLHGGANMALAESVGSLGSFVLLNDPTIGVVGLEINGNHIKSTKSGKVKAYGKLLHKGRSTHVWEINIKNEADEILTICRMTNMIIRKS